MVHFLIPGISRPYLDFPVKAANEENQDYCHKLVIRLHRVCRHFFLICPTTVVKPLGVGRNEKMWFSLKFLAFLNALFSPDKSPAESKGFCYLNRIEISFKK